jgi:hypothetical protein
MAQACLGVKEYRPILLGLFTLPLANGERHLRHVLRSYQQYYNGTRTHVALGKDSPLTRPVQAVGRILALPVLGGLHHRYIRI